MNKKQLIIEFNNLNNSDAFCFIITKFKTSYYSYDNLIRNLKDALKKNKIKNKDFNYLEFLDYIKTDIINIIQKNGVDSGYVLDSYLDNLITNFDFDLDFLNQFVKAIQ